MAVALTTATDGLNRIPVTAGNNAASERKANAAGVLDASASQIRPGIIPGPSVWQLTYGSPTADTWYVGQGSAYLSDGAGGAFIVTNGSQKSEAVTRPGAGTSRYDVIALEPVYTGTPAVTLTRYPGTAAASPTLSSATSLVSANGLIIGYYLLGNTGAPTITMLPKRTADAGGVVRVYDATDLATLNPVPGDLAFQEDVGQSMLRVGGAWVPTAQGAFTPYVPVLSATTTSPTLGTGGTAQAGWSANGKNITYQFKFLFGSTMTAGSGTYLISLPVPPSTTWSNRFVGTGMCFDSSASGLGPVVLRVNGTASTLVMQFPATWPGGTAASVTHVNLFPWAAGDEIHGAINYEAA